MTHRLWIIYNDSQSSKKRNIWKKKCEIFVKNTSMLKMKLNESLQSRSWLVTFLRVLMLPPVSLRPLVVKISTWESCQPSTGKNWSRLLQFVFTSFLIRWLTSSHLNLIRPFRTGLIHFRTIRKFDRSNFRRIKTFGKSKFCNGTNVVGNQNFRVRKLLEESIIAMSLYFRLFKLSGESKFSENRSFRSIRQIINLYSWCKISQILLIPILVAWILRNKKSVKLLNSLSLTWTCTSQSVSIHQGIIQN